MSVLFTDECSTVGDLINWANKSEIPVETVSDARPTDVYIKRGIPTNRKRCRGLQYDDLKN